MERRFIADSQFRLAVGEDDPQVYGQRRTVEEDLPLISAEYECLAAELVSRARRGREIDFYHFNLDLAGGPCLPKRLSGCGAGCAYLAVAPQGDLYPCHQFVGRPDYRLGDVDRGVARSDLRAMFRRAHIYNKEDCGECWARFYCSGGCHANAEALNGDIHQPFKRLVN